MRDRRCRRFKETWMKRIITSMLAAATLTVALAGTATDASAQWRRGWGPAAVVGGVAAGVIIGSAIASTYGPAYVVQPGYVAYPGYAIAPPVGCPGGYWARQPVLFDAYGNPVRWSRPRFFCPQY
jgi:hypothetical protein